jgi:hypothetical protein
MRDHDYRMLSTTKHFAKWRERHRITFHFDKRFNAAESEAQLPSFVIPRPYSVALQERRTVDGGGGWHIPLLDAAKQTLKWACVWKMPQNLSVNIGAASTSDDEDV